MPMRQICQKVETNFKWKISKGNVNIGTLIVLHIFEKASVKMDIWYLKIEGHKIEHLEIWLTMVG